ncbi:Transglycosylase SLT domain-containing protein [Rhizobium mongolense subsp. loessense]|uniref:Transglycosylase SLT domain-containing protein n=1 Tax=Rhizobium mongolense subsp. loessense TaxID=158890 RepID=A0A1G4T6W7_9HYPH|nr:transglycosylase SLT domain-containing protein [Rhizobium mongolense]SCW77031.1 Transglycosylase SLT domain-containing protein [Rhizobium mongolense subsp. loessense]
MADIRSIIIDAANRYGVDQDYALRTAQIESGLNPHAQNKTSSAGGLYQFIDSTWGKYGNGASKFDAYASADAFMRFTRDNQNFLKKKLGRDLSKCELYLAHQQGAGGALNLLANPNAMAVNLVGRAAVVGNGGQTGMLASEFAGLWAKKMGDTVVGNGPAGLVMPGSMGNSQNPGDFSVHDQGRISTSDVVPTMNVTRAEEVQQEKDRQAAQPSYGDAIATAVKNEWSILTPFRALGHYDPEPDYKLTKEKLEAFGQSIPDEYLDEFEDAVSDEHAAAIRDRLLTQLEDNRKIASLGTAGTIISFGAALTDPGAIAATAAIGAVTGGLGAPAAVAARLGRVGMVGLAAAEGVAGNLATDIPLTAVDPTRDVSFDELKYSIGTGLVMGGVMGAFRRNPMFTEEAKQIAKLGEQMRTEAATPTANPGSVGAAAVMGDNFTRSDTSNLIDDFKRLDPKGRFLNWRMDTVGQLMNSKNPMAQAVARYLGEDGVRAKRGSGVVTQIAATERMQRRLRVAQINWYRGYDDAWKKYRKANGINGFKSQDAKLRFNEQITDYIREENLSVRAQFPAEVKQAAGAFQSEMKSFWKEAQELGLTRTEIGVENYFPRYPHLAKATKLIRQIGYSMDEKGGLTDLFRDAILKRQPDIDPAIAKRMGYAVLDRMQKLSSGEEMFGSGSIGFDLDDLEVELKHYLDDDQIANVKAWASRNTKKEDEASGAARMKARIMLDENHFADVWDKHGGRQKLSIADFYVKDPHTAFQLYSRNMSGQIAMARIQVRDPVTGDLLVDGIRNANDWTKLKNQIKSVGEASGANNTLDEKNLDFLYSAITGTPLAGIDRGSDGATFLRMLRDFNFLRLMGQVGFSQVPEFGRQVSQVGIKTTFQAVPSFRHLIDMARSGKMTDEVAEELDALGAFGTDYERTAHYLDMDEMGVPITSGTDSMTQRVAGAVNPKLHAMNRFVSMGSGMAPINRVFQKWSARAAAVKFTKMAMFGDKIDAERLRALGLGKDDADKIFEAIRTHATFKGGVKSPSKLQSLGIKNWDGNTLSLFEDAMFRLNRTMILENDPGQMHRWMAHPLGQMVMQFRTFAMAAHTKALLQGLNLRDGPAIFGMLASSFLGSLVYAGQIHLNLLGREDREDQLKERLSWSKLALAGFSRSSESALIPMAADIGWQFFGDEPIFDTRSSGLKTTMQGALGNPTGDLISTGFAGVAGVTSAAFGDDYSQTDWQNLTRVLPFSRMMGAVQFLNWAGSGLPRRELRD